MRCVATRKDGTPCPYSASVGVFCRVHAALLPKLKGREARQARELEATRLRIATLEATANHWEGNPS